MRVCVCARVYVYACRHPWMLYEGYSPGERVQMLPFEHPSRSVLGAEGMHGQLQCVHVCVYIYIYVCMYVCMYIYIYVYICVYACMNVCCPSTSILIEKHIHKYYLYIYIYVHTHTHTHTRTCTHTYKHTHTHTCILEPHIIIVIVQPCHVQARLPCTHCVKRSTTRTPRALNACPILSPTHYTCELAAIFERFVVETCDALHRIRGVE